MEILHNPLTEFAYCASDEKGHIVRGTLAAADQRDLSAKLQELRLFLITAAVVTPNPEAMDAVLPEVSPEFLPAVTPSKNPAGPMRSHRQKLLAGVLVVSVALLLFQLHHRHLTRHVRTAALNQAIALVRPGMLRTDIDKQLGTIYPGNSDPNKVWYSVPPQFILEILYETKIDKAGHHQSISRTINILKAPNPI